MVTDGGNFHLLHTKIRVKDLDRSIDFYTRHFKDAGAAQLAS